MKCYFILIMHVMLCYYSFSQQYSKKQNFKKDSIHFQQLIDSVKYYRNSDQNKAELFLEKAAQLNVSYKNAKWTANIFKLKAILYFLKGGTKNLEKAIEFQKSELEISRDLKDSIKISGALNNLSIFYSRSKDYSSSVKYALANINLLKSMSLEEDKLIELGQAYARMGDIYLNLKFVDSSLAYHQRAYDIFTKTEMPDHYDLKSASLVKLGYINHNYKNNYEKALLSYTKAYKEFDKKNLNSLSQVSMLTGEVYKDMRLYDEALFYYKKALSFIEKSKQEIASKTNSLSSIYIQIAENYYLTSQPDSTLLYVNKVLNVSESGILQNLELEMLANDIKSKALEKKGDSLLSLRHFKKAQLLRDSINKLKNIPKTTEVLLNNEKSQLLEKEKGFLKKLSKKNKIVFGSIFLAIIVLICSYIFYLRYKKRLNILRKKQEKLTKNLNYAVEQKDSLSRRITASSANLAIKNDLLLKIGELLNKLSEKISSEGDKNTIKDTQYLISDTLELNKMWDTFFVHFEEVHPKFIENLKDNYNLSLNELRLCAFLKMNLTYKEIGQILNITQSSLHVTVHRLKKKLNLPKEESVFDFLYSFSTSTL